jgi:hypothetical protein
MNDDSIDIENLYKVDFQKKLMKQLCALKHILAESRVYKGRQNNFNYEN